MDDTKLVYSEIIIDIFQESAILIENGNVS